MIWWPQRPVLGRRCRGVSAGPRSVPRWEQRLAWASESRGQRADSNSRLPGPTGSRSHDLHSPLSSTLPTPVLLIPNPAPGWGTCAGPSGTAGAPQGPCVLKALQGTRREMDTQLEKFHHSLLVTPHSIKGSILNAI